MNIFFYYSSHEDTIEVGTAGPEDIEIGIPLSNYIGHVSKSHSQVLFEELVEELGLKPGSYVGLRLVAKTIGEFKLD